ncbi:hypothetical protein ACHAXT_010031 [Thalassiosira profunda]
MGRRPSRGEGRAGWAASKTLFSGDGQTVAACGRTLLFTEDFPGRTSPSPPPLHNHRPSPSALVARRRCSITTAPTNTPPRPGPLRTSGSTPAGRHRLFARTNRSRSSPITRDAVLAVALPSPACGPLRRLQHTAQRPAAGSRPSKRRRRGSPSLSLLPALASRVSRQGCGSDWIARSRRRVRPIPAAMAAIATEGRPQPAGSDVILIPKEEDILIAHGEEAKYHPGSVFYRDYCESRREEYKNLGKQKKLKQQFVLGMVRSLKKSRRVLQYSDNRRGWIAMCDDEFRKRILHRFKEGPPKLRDGTYTRVVVADATIPSEEVNDATQPKRLKTEHSSKDGPACPKQCNGDGCDESKMVCSPTDETIDDFDGQLKSHVWKDWLSDFTQLNVPLERIFDGMFLHGVRGPSEQGPGFPVTADNSIGTTYPLLSLERPAYLRMNLGQDDPSKKTNNPETTYRATYGTGSGIRTHGIPKHHLTYLKYTSDHDIVASTVKDWADVEYANDKEMKILYPNSTVGVAFTRSWGNRQNIRFHRDQRNSPDGDFVQNENCQMQYSPTFILVVADARILQFQLMRHKTKEERKAHKASGKKKHSHHGGKGLIAKDGLSLGLVLRPVTHSFEVYKATGQLVLSKAELRQSKMKNSLNDDIVNAFLANEEYRKRSEDELRRLWLTAKKKYFDGVKTEEASI